MPRTTPSEKIQTRAARSRLPQRRKPHWLCLRPGQLHLGYVRRNADQAGHWTVRRYNGGGTYKVTRLPGVADDVEAANGATVLSFAQAQDLALRPTPQAQTAAPMTVAQAMADYVDYLQTSGREGAAITAERAGRLHVLPQLGEVQVQALTTEQLRHWLAALANRLAKRNGHEDALRRSRATANRILGTLRAALNHAYAECRVPSDNAWRGRLKPFRNVAVARKRYLSIPEAQRLLNAAQGDFRALVQAALQTGARYSELTRLKVHDFDAASCTVGIGKSKAGRPRRVYLTEEGTAFFHSITVGRSGDELMLHHHGGKPWARSDQWWPMHHAVKRAKLDPPDSFHTLRHTYASLALMNGVPMQVVSENLGHADTRMIEKHYGHLAPSHKRDAIRAGAARFGLVATSNVRPLR